MSAAEDNPPRLRVPSQETSQAGPDPFQLLVSGYIIGALLHGGLDLSLITVEATTNDRRSSFTVESKASRKRLHVTVREETEQR
jgi:hypothetical protein